MNEFDNDTESKDRENDYQRYVSYETNDEGLVIYDSIEHTAWIKIESEFVVDFNASEPFGGDNMEGGR